MYLYRTLIIEDDTVEKQLLQHHLSQLPNLSMIGSFDNPLSAVSLLHQEQVDILFLDVNLPGIDGLSFLSTLQRPPRVILTTADPAHALKAFEIGVVDYLVKPYTFERLLRAVSRVIGANDSGSSPDAAPTYIFLKTGRESVRVAVEDILYIEAFGAISKVYTKTSVLVVSELLANLHQQLPAGAFIRVHKSYIVSQQSITRIGSRHVSIQQHQIPLGATYREQVEKTLWGK